MARALLVEIIGDSTGLESSLAKADVAASGFGSKLGSLAKMAALALGAGALGGIALVLDKSVKAALAGQVSQVALNTALKATNQSVTAMTPALNAAEAAARKMGFTDDTSREALAKLEVATGSTKKAVSDLSVAEDIARFKHIDLTSASQMLAMAMTGSQRAVKQLGINVAPVTANLDALKASHVNLTTASGHLLEAHAKLLDKMATGNAVIALTSEKLHGQAQAFADTAAGGMAQFQAQLQHIEESIGNALLPILEQAVDWVNSNWPEIQAVFKVVFDAIGAMITAIKPYFDLLVGWVGDAVAYVQQHWTQISAAVSSVMSTVQQVITDTVSVVKGIWQQFGGAITSIIQTAVDTVISVFKDLYNAVVGVVNLVSDIIHGKWSQVWGDLKQIVSSALDALGTIISAAISTAVTAALALGKAILQGIVKGLAALGQLVLKALEAIPVAIAGVAGAAVSAALNIGRQIVNGVISGVESMASSLANKVKGVVDSAVNFVKSGFGIFSPSKVMADQVGTPLALGVIEGWLTGSIGLPAAMSASVTKAVTAATAVVTASKTAFTSAFGGFTSIADQMFGGIAGSMQTKAGAALAKLTDQHNAAGLKAAVTTAQTNLNTVTGAIGIEDPVAVAAAQQQLNDALYNQKVAALTKQAAAEQKQLTATNAIRQIDFDKALAQLQDHLAKGHTSTKVAMADIEALLRKYGVTFGNVGADMGTAWVQGLKDAITNAASHGGSLASVLKQQADSIKVPHLDTGGYVAQSGIAMVHKGENVVPAGGRMAGGNSYQLTVHALDPHSAATAVVEAITVWEHNNGPRYARA